MQFCNYTRHEGSHTEDLCRRHRLMQDDCSPVWVVIRAVNSVTGTYYALYPNMIFPRRKRRRQRGSKAPMIPTPCLPPLRSPVPRLGPFISRTQRDTGSYGKTVSKKALVDIHHCTGCGICQNVCPVGSITVTDMAVVDPRTCTGCGICIDACPVGAMTLG